MPRAIRLTLQRAGDEISTSVGPGDQLLVLGRGRLGLPRDRNQLHRRHAEVGWERGVPIVRRLGANQVGILRGGSKLRVGSGLQRGALQDGDKLFFLLHADGLEYTVRIVDDDASAATDEGTESEKRKPGGDDEEAARPAKLRRTQNQAIDAADEAAWLEAQIAKLSAVPGINNLLPSGVRTNVQQIWTSFGPQELEHGIANFQQQAIVSCGEEKQQSMAMVNLLTSCLERRRAFKTSIPSGAAAVPAGIAATDAHAGTADSDGTPRAGGPPLHSGSKDGAAEVSDDEDDDELLFKSANDCRPQQGLRSEHRDFACLTTVPRPRPSGAAKLILRRMQAGKYPELVRSDLAPPPTIAHGIEASIALVNRRLRTTAPGSGPLGSPAFPETHMPALGFGCHQLTKSESKVAIPEALRIGYRLIDTAPGYGNRPKGSHRGDNEQLVGDAIQNSGLPRSQLFITTKLNNKDHGYEQAISAVQESLSRLRLDYVDLLLVHSPCPFNHGMPYGPAWQGTEAGTRLESWRACEECLRRGLTKSIGVSNYGEHHLDELLASATVSPSINQVEVSPFNQRRNLLAYCAERSIPVQAWGSLTAGQQLRPPRNAPWPPGYAKEKARSNEDGTSPVLVQVAREAGCTVAQVLLRWGLQKGLGVLPRSRHPPHIKENWAARPDGGLHLSDSAINRLDALDEGRVTAWNPAVAP